MAFSTALFIVVFILLCGSGGSYGNSDTGNEKMALLAQGKGISTTQGKGQTATDGNGKMTTDGKEKKIIKSEVNATTEAAGVAEEAEDEVTTAKEAAEEATDEAHDASAKERDVSTEASAGSMPQMS
ncbi:unnamed protein product [Acanthocheilonema viteae]|uniref:Uncharacterized protein n=1 Tax=Acanthocheilonema viteae TaxID=6277 RepID=A0A498S942_ACAVI|nr:unnamed protein product [Acanthocheilonema viteae]